MSLAECRFVNCDGKQDTSADHRRVLLRRHLPQNRWIWERSLSPGGVTHQRGFVEVLSISWTCFYHLKCIAYLEVNVMAGLIGDNFTEVAGVAIYVSSECAL